MTVIPPIVVMDMQSLDMPFKRVYHLNGARVEPLHFGVTYIETGDEIIVVYRLDMP